MTAADYLKRARAASVFVDPPGALSPFIGALEKVLELHSPTTGCETGIVGGCEKCSDVQAHCAECLDDMPCPTVRVITEALTGGESDDPR